MASGCNISTILLTCNRAMNSQETRTQLLLAGAGWTERKGGDVAEGWLGASQEAAWNQGWQCSLTEEWGSLPSRVTRGTATASFSRAFGP